MIRIQPRFPTHLTGTAVALALVVLGAVLLAGCTSQTGPIVSVNTPAPVPSYISTLPNNATVMKIEAFHFYPTRRCESCITVGSYANATISTYFADELASGKIVFREINGELPENRDLVEKYGVTSSSLRLGIYTSDGRFYPEEIVKVWYKTDNQQRYMDYLKGVIERRMAGDLSAV